MLMPAIDSLLLVMNKNLAHYYAEIHERHSFAIVTILTITNIIKYRIGIHLKSIVTGNLTKDSIMA